VDIVKISPDARVMWVVAMQLLRCFCWFLTGPS